MPPERIQVGNLLEGGSYDFDTRGGTFGLIFAYDVIQQLPRSLQASACEMMAHRMAPGGALVVFDHERLSLYGAKMGFKKIVTRITRIPLVPRYFCAARYPSLRSLGRRMAARGWTVNIRRSRLSPKRALVVC